MLKLAISKSSCDLFQIKPDNNLINHFSVVVKWLRLVQKNDSKKNCASDELLKNKL